MTRPGGYRWSTNPMQHREATFSLMVHGGAGTLDLAANPAHAQALHHAIARVLAAGRALLEKGAPALDAVEHCVTLLEDDPLFNAGRGSVLNEFGRVEMDAAIMDGRSLAAGAVAAVHGIANPVRLARRVMDDTPHILLVGDGAMRFAEQCGMPLQPDDYFLLPERLAQLERARARRATGLDHAVENDNGKLGTVGAVARDLRGDLAAATSTGGLVNKRMGRVGHSPLVGAGVYGDNRSCAVSATGVGEDLMRIVLAKTVADLVELWGLDGPAAAHAAIDRLRERVAGQGGLIVIDRAGRCAGAGSTPNLIHGWIENSGATVVRLEPQ
jgi:beta-aspartyl-peptidase (threonine type)